jgi:hypothetical protein
MHFVPTMQKSKQRTWLLYGKKLWMIRFQLYVKYIVQYMLCGILIYILALHYHSE